MSGVRLSIFLIICTIHGTRLSAEAGPTFPSQYLNGYHHQQKTLTAFWISNDDKISNYFKKLNGTIPFDEEQARPLKVSDFYLNKLRNLSAGIDTTSNNQLKVLEVGRLDSLDVVSTGRNRVQRNETCQRWVAYDCSYMAMVTYESNCRMGNTIFRCNRTRNEKIQHQCRRRVTFCCEGYQVGRSGYCERKLNQEESGCGGMRVLQGRTGVLQSPEYPNDYPSGLNCIWTIIAKRREHIILKFLDLDTEVPSSLCDLKRGNCFELCSHDVFTLRDRITNSTNTLCGNLLPQTEYLYSGHSVDLSFASDYSNAGRGFKVAYSVVTDNDLPPQECSNGQVWSLCRRICRLTCEDTYSSRIGPWNICIKSDGNNKAIDTSERDDETCVPGCACPSDRPVWHEGNCVKVEHCRRKIFQCGLPLDAPIRKILGGETAPDGDWPWIVQVSDNLQHADCAGTLVCSDWVITAAHCFLNRATWTMPSNIDLNEFWFHLGKYWQYKQVDKRKIESFRASRIIIHPEYNFTNDLNDLALVQLAGYARQWDRIRPICLPPALPRNITTEEQWESRGSFPGIGDQCLAAGWGVTKNFGPDPSQLKQVRLPIQPASSCRYSSYEWKKIICAGGLINADTCQGDSGGPFVCQQNNRCFLRGITSFGDGCGAGIPGGYTRISYYMPWIRNIIGDECGV